MRFVIRHLSGRESGRKLTFAPGRVRIGRDDDCDVRFDVQRDIEVSGQHCELELRADGAHTVTDLQSTNGTWLNGEEIERAPLAPGDVIELGPGGPRLRFEVPRGLWARLIGFVLRRWVLRRWVLRRWVLRRWAGLDHP